MENILAELHARNEIRRASSLFTGLIREFTTSLHKHARLAVLLPRRFSRCPRATTRAASARQRSLAEAHRCNFPPPTPPAAGPSTALSSSSEFVAAPPIGTAVIVPATTPAIAVATIRLNSKPSNPPPNPI